MHIVKKLPTYGLVALLAGLLLWSIFSPRGDFVKKVAETLEEQKKRADLFFSGVTVSEIMNGIKYWELKARTSELNKATNITNLSEVNGIFFENGKKTLKILAPSAVWRMNNKEIFLDSPIGFDTNFERAYRGRLSDLRKISDPRSVFNIPLHGKPSEHGYWFNAHNLFWRLEDKRIVCTSGIMLTKGNLVVTSDRLEADVGLEHIKLIGSPEGFVENIAFSARTIEVDSANDRIFALGGVRGKRTDATISSQTAIYDQALNEVDFKGGVEIEFGELRSISDTAKYFVSTETAILKGRVSAKRGGSDLKGEEIHISFRDGRVSVKGKTRVKIGTKELTAEAD